MLKTPENPKKAVIPDFEPTIEVEVVDVEIASYPIAWGDIQKVFKISPTTSRKYAEQGMGMLRGQPINSDEQLFEFCKLVLWCELGKRGGRGNTAYSPAAYFDLREEDRHNPGTLMQKLSEVGIDERRIQDFFQQTRNRLQSRGYGTKCR